MIHRLPALLRHLLVGLACVVWVAGASGTQLHDVLYTHVWCAEHGVVEHGSEIAVADVHGSGPMVRSADSSSHGEACGFDGVPPAAWRLPATAPVLAYVLPLYRLSPIALAQAPRGPPLRFAPKTSPPLAA